MDDASPFTEDMVDSSSSEERMVYANSFLNLFLDTKSSKEPTIHKRIWLNANSRQGYGYQPNEN